MQQPHCVVNVQNTNRQEQGQQQRASMRQLPVKEKVINNTARALDGLLDRKVLMTGFMALVLPRYKPQLLERELFWVWCTLTTREGICAFEASKPVEEEYLSAFS